MNQVELGPERQIIDSDPTVVVSEEAYDGGKGIFVLSADAVLLMAHRRQKAFHEREMNSPDMPAPQAALHREQYALHVAATEALGDVASTAAGAEVIPFPTPAPASVEQPVLQYAMG